MREARKGHGRGMKRVGETYTYYREKRKVRRCEEGKREWKQEMSERKEIEKRITN